MAARPPCSGMHRARRAASEPRSCPTRSGKTCTRASRDAVEAGSTVYTDALQSYNGLDGEYDHKTIDHAETLRGRACPHERR